METLTKTEPLVAPFPWFGGKRRVAAEVWRRFGRVKNYIEPFFGSGAALLARPQVDGVETVNDVDCYLTNFWRAVRADPAGVARWADYPVSELDQNARHLWLVSRADLRERMNTDPDWYDVKAAGWWVWGQNVWIGDGWCCRRFWRDSSDAGTGVHRKLPHLGNAGKGVHRQLPHLGNAGTGVEEWIVALSVRLRRVRICCGGWERVLSPSVATKHGLTAVFLDPPYASQRDQAYACEGPEQVAPAVREWAIANGEDPSFRIALCGYEGEHVMPEGWTEHAWVARKGYQKSGENGHHSGRLERVWFSPHCLSGEQGSLFSEEALSA